MDLPRSAKSRGLPNLYQASAAIQSAFSSAPCPGVNCPVTLRKLSVEELSCKVEVVREFRMSRARHRWGPRACAPHANEALSFNPAQRSSATLGCAVVSPAHISRFHPE